METIRFIVGVILPYLAIAIFVVGMALRLLNWKRLASPPMTLYPPGSEEGGATANVLKEAFLFRSLFRGDRALWVFAWAFHVVLALIFLGHLRVVFNVDGILGSLGMSEASISAISSAVGGAAGILIFIVALVLLARRMTVPRVKEITGFGDYAILMLVAVVIVTGNLLRFGGEHIDVSATQSYFASLATFSGVADSAALQNRSFVVHLGLALLMIMLIPFSKILHFGGIFFTQSLIRKK